MKKIALIAFVSILSTACNTKVNSSDIPKINGYWEIEKVIFSDGKTKEYTINESFDYFEVKNNIGIRKKVMPQLDGTFLVNDAFENVKINEVNEKQYINYSTSFSKWKEEVRSISDEKLILINDAKNEYHYKRAAPINITGDGKKAK